MFKVANYKKKKKKKKKEKTNKKQQQYIQAYGKKMGVVSCHEEAQKDLKNLYELPKMRF